MFFVLEPDVSEIQRALQENSFDRRRAQHYRSGQPAACDPVLEKTNRLMTLARIAPVLFVLLCVDGMGLRQIRDLLCDP